MTLCSRAHLSGRDADAAEVPRLAEVAGGWIRQDVNWTGKQRE